jgi:hypothetical protein
VLAAIERVGVERRSSGESSDRLPVLFGFEA